MSNWNVVPVVRAKNVRRALEYYRQALGFHCEAGLFGDQSDEEDGVYAVLERQGAGLHIQIRRDEAHRSTRENIATDAYFYVDDAKSLQAEFEASGARFHRKLVTDNAYDLDDFVVEDLDGNRLAFGSTRRRS